jgi:chemotaxis signal transduction protein
MSAATELLFCDVGDRRFAFRSRDVWHVERAEHLRREPGDGGRIGVLMLGKVAVEVFSLAAVLGVPAGPSAAGDGHIAVTGNSHGLFGWLADRIGRADSAAAPHIAPLPPFIGAPAQAWFEGVVRIEQQRPALLIRPQCINPLFPEAPSARTDLVIPPEPSFQSAAAAEPVAVIFKTGALPASAAVRYAVSAKQIAAIVHTDTPMAVSGCADHVVGVTWWRRTIVPVIDFNRGRDRSAETQHRLLIARCGPAHHGALVALSIAPEVLMCRPDGTYRERRDLARPWFASGVFDVNGEAVALVDLDAIVAPRASGPRDGDAVLPDLLIERAARDAEALGGALDPPALGA